MASDFDDFDSRLKRLKACLGVREDQQVAEALGMSKAALSARKQRGSFPVDRLFVLSTGRPDLDVTYVLTGDRSVTGSARDKLESTARMFGGLPQTDPETGELLAQLAADVTGLVVQLRERRSHVYDALLESLDRMSDSSVSLLSAVASRMAAADVEEELRKLHARHNSEQGDGETAPAKRSGRQGHSKA